MDECGGAGRDKVAGGLAQRLNERGVYGHRDLQMDSFSQK